MSLPSAPALQATSSATRFLGWRVVGAAFVAQFLSSGATFASFGVFVIPLTEALDVTRGAALAGSLSDERAESAGWQ